MARCRAVGPGLFVIVTALAVPAAGQLAPSAQAPDGADLYRRSCAQCHDAGVGRAPNRDQFRSMSPDRVVAAMETGSMITMATNRTAVERRAIAEFLTGQSFASALSSAPAPRALCTGSGTTFNPGPDPAWNGWGNGTANNRFQSAAKAGLQAADVPRLKLKWAFAFPGDLQSWAQATVVGGRLFTGSWGGKVYALNAATGCIHWYYDAGAGVRSAVSVGRVQTAGGPRVLAFFGDTGSYLHALDAATGAPVWKVRTDDFPSARISSSPVLYNGRIYVGMASGEEGQGAVPTYECCRFRGSIVALDAATGERVWKTYVVDEPKPTMRNAAGAQMWGPSGAPIWGTPAVDPVKNALYVTTGNNYSDPTSPMSDSFVAMDLATGRILWHRQMTAADAYTAACRLPDKTNCAASNGPDFDFGASPILVSANGRRLLVAGQKSGIVHALDPDRDGAVVWQARVGKGGTMGGVQWGSATDGANVYVANSDIGRVMLTYSQRHRCGPQAGRRHVRAAPVGRRARVVHAARRLWGPAALQSRTVGRRQRHPRHRILGVGGRPHARVLRNGRQNCLGREHDRHLRIRQRRPGPRRLDRRARTSHRQRHRLRQLGLSDRRRNTRQRAARVLDRREVGRLRSFR